jgi:predicted GNAT family acetyltransferase
MPYLHRYEIAHFSEETLMELPDHGLRGQVPPPNFAVRRAKLDDLTKLIEFFANAGEMSRSPGAVERPLRDRRVWMALKGDAVVSAALTNAETDRFAMVGGVYTMPAWRGLRLSQAVCSALCDELAREGRRPVLYWDNAIAGYIYTKLGFQPIGTWRSLRLTRR